MQDLISVVIPVYNMGETIEKCVKSIVAQNNSIQMEIIIVDDGSKDNTPQICDKLANIYKNVYSFHKENEGAGPARNYGIKKAKGKFIFFPDADDILANNAISIMFNAMKERECDLLVFGFQSQTELGKIVFKKNYPNMILKGENIRNNYSDYIGYGVKYPIQGAPWNKLFDLDIIKENNIMFPSLRRHQDEAFIARYMCYAKKICFISDILYVHFVNDLQKEWDKYPVDYIKSVMGLRKNRKETILRWNPKDLETKEWMNCEYICGVIKACELTFSPKSKFPISKRKEKIIKYIEKTAICDFYNNSKIGMYQKAIMFFAKHRLYSLTLLTMGVKITFEKKGLLQLLKNE